MHFEIEDSSNGPRALNVQRNGESRQEQQQIINSDILSVDSSIAHIQIESVKILTDTLVRSLKKNPMDLYNLHPKVFEELVAEIFMSNGYTTEFIGSWNQADGGVDILAIRRDEAGFPVRYAIQCKRYSAQRRITAEPIRALAGVLDRFRAHIGVIATTSYFSKPARDEVEAIFLNISLRDYEYIKAALKRLDLLRF